MVVRGWVPVPGSVKGRLALLAFEEFGRRGYERVNVVDLAARGGVTTGSLYHHFGSKQGLYDVVRTEAEQRMLDRMEGAAAAAEARPVRAAFLVAFDAAVKQTVAGLLAEAHPDRGSDPLEGFIADRTNSAITARLLIAVWRAALGAVADGVAPARVRAALAEAISV